VTVLGRAGLEDQASAKERIMRKTFGVLAAAALVVALSTTAALAQSPHFVLASAAVNNSADLVASFKVADLGDSETILVMLSADATAQYACFNKGGHHKKTETVSGPVSASGEFTSGQKLSVTGSLTVSAPSQGDFSCPNGQRLVLTFVQYSNVSLTADTAEGTVSAEVPGTFTFGAPV
jgi:hypothetical protein